MLLVGAPAVCLHVGNELYHVLSQVMIYCGLTLKGEWEMRNEEMG